MPLLWLDLDGTLLDVTERYFQLHRQLCAELDLSSAVSRKDYWELKKCSTPLPRLLGLAETDPRLPVYRKKWLSEIETEVRLEADTLFPFAMETLESLRRSHRLRLITQRRNSSTARIQIRRLGLQNQFEQVLVAETLLSDAPGETKAYAIRKQSTGSLQEIVVGDTEYDILAARQLGLRSAAVLSGIRDRAFLETLRPDWVLSDLRKLESALCP